MREELFAHLTATYQEELVRDHDEPSAMTRAMERFGNPYIRHELISISLNSVSKWKVRVLPTVKDFAAKNGRAPAGLAFSLAALLWFYKGELTGADYIGRRDAGPYPIKDEAQVIDILAAAWKEAKAGQAAGLVAKLLADSRLWGEDLTRVPGLAEQAGQALGAIEAQGLKAAMAALVAA